MTAIEPATAKMRSAPGISSFKNADPNSAPETRTMIKAIPDMIAGFFFIMPQPFCRFTAPLPTGVSLLAVAEELTANSDV